MLHPNETLQIPAARSHFIKYAAINKLISLLEHGSTSLGYDELLIKIGGKPQRLEKLVKDLTTFNELFSFLREDALASNRVAPKASTGMGDNSDAAQAVGHISIDVKKMNIDLFQCLLIRHTDRRALYCRRVSPRVGPIPIIHGA
jgi:hypothetical protein